MEFLNTNQIKVEITKKPKKLTATRFATILGLNTWQPPFSAWCEITRTYQEPFEDTMYTIAGKTIEPKIINYLNETYFLNIKDPSSVYGKDYFKQTKGDFFSHKEVFGGMWDAIGNDFVVEIKTTKRAEDWKIEIPIYYKLQASLYAYLLGLDRVIITASFLQDEDYARPSAFIPTVDNTIMCEFKLSEEFPRFKEDYIIPAIEWWNNYVITGISPVFDEEKDATILKALRTNKAEVTEKEILELLKQADRLQLIIDEMREAEVQLKVYKEQIKAYMTKLFRDGDRRVQIQSEKFDWILSKVVANRVDNNALKKDGLYEKYTKKNETLILKNNPIRQEE